MPTIVRGFWNKSRQNASGKDSRGNFGLKTLRLLERASAEVIARRFVLSPDTETSRDFVVSSLTDLCAVLASMTYPSS